MRQVLLTLAVLAALGLAGAVAVVGLGLYNVSARAGHLPGVSWVLHTTFRNAVRLRAPSMDEAPDLTDPALIELGARHYDTACKSCHAAPGDARTATTRHMVPVPPHVTEAVADWEANHLHWIVAEGIKMSGMPGWPAEGREDEVWAVVAYLMAVKRGLTVEGQAGLVARQREDGPMEAPYCSGCHGGVNGFVPRLDIQDADYLARALAEYRSGARQSGIMAQATSVVEPEVLESLARHYGDLVPEGAPGDGGALAERGEELARRGTGDVPACTACHGPGATRASAAFPSLTGQDRAFLDTQLHLWRDGGRTGSELMAQAAAELTDAEIEALAAWYASLAPANRTAGEVPAPAAWIETEGESGE